MASVFSKMNPREHVWDALGRRAAGRQPPPQTLQELERAFLEEWGRIPELVISSLFHSMPQSEQIRKCTFMLDSVAKEVSRRPKQTGFVRGKAFLHVLRRRPIGCPDSLNVPDNARCDEYDREQHFDYTIF
ncbi:transposable element Tcb2 transposase [Trichonephila clavipes]|nr:transposable element Tcb2 transposase [Trichonephila clavipes]